MLDPTSAHKLHAVDAIESPRLFRSSASQHINTVTPRLYIFCRRTSGCSSAGRSAGRRSMDTDRGQSQTLNDLARRAQLSCVLVINLTAKTARPPASLLWSGLTDGSPACDEYN